MSHAEDQANEVEALKSIYDQDFIVPPKTTGFGFWIKVRPDTGGGAPAHVGATLHVTLPSMYPDEKPAVLVSGDKGLSPEQVAALSALAVETAEENIGTPCIYTVVERLREWLVEHNEPAGEGSAYDEMVKRQRALERVAADVGKPTGSLLKSADPSIKHKAPVASDEEKELERRRHDGTPVTVASFIAWRDGFEREVEERRKADEARGAVGSRILAGRLTGKQMFEADATLATSDIALESIVTDSPLGTPVGGEGGAIDASLFEGGGDFSEDDDDDEDYDESDDDDDDDEEEEDDEDEDDEEDAEAGAGTAAVAAANTQSRKGK